jgi:hypothetical protein
MNVPNETNAPDEASAPSDDAPENSSSDSSGTGAANNNTNKNNGENRLGPHPLVSADEWDRLRAPFSREAYVVDSRAVGYAPEHLPGENAGEALHPSVIDLRLRPEAVRDRLDLVVGPDRWSYRFEPGRRDGGGNQSVFCHLRIGSASRSGIGTSPSLRVAHRAALASAAVAFGIGASGLATGPMAAEKEVRHEVPDPVLEALEKRADPSRWAPAET